MIKTILKVLGVLVGAVVIAGGLFFGIYVYPFMKEMKKVTTISYDPQLTLLIGGGGNSGILVSDSLVLVIDTKMDDAASELAKRVKEMAAGRPIIVVNTHVHTDHTGGNKYFKGHTIVAGGNYDQALWKGDAGAEGMPTVWLKDSMVIPMGNETVTLLNIGWNAHTQSDVMVYLHGRQMLFGGDVVLNHQAAAMFAKYNACADGYLKAMDYLMARYTIAHVVPGHGPLGGADVLANFKQYIVDVKAAADNPDQEQAIIAKYKEWNQVPMVMSPGANIKYVRGMKGC